MERIVYIRGKFRGTNKEMKEAYFYAKEMMTKYDLKPQYIGVMAEEGWTGDKILTIKRKEKKLLEDLEKNKKIESIEVITKEMEGKEIIDNKSYFLINQKYGIIAFWTNTNIEEIDFKEILEEMKEAYFYAKEMMRKYDLEPQYIGVTADEGWKGDKILTIKRKEKQLLKDLEKNILIKNIGLETKEIEGKEIKYSKSFFLIDKENAVIAFWTNTNIEEINFKEILENMKEYVEPGIEEICDWESDAIPLRYIWEGEKTLTPDNIIPKKVTHIYKKVTPLDIPIEV